MTLWLATHVSHFSALVPAAFVSVRRVHDRAFLWVATAFAASFLADIAVLLSGHSWGVLAIYPVIQFGLFAAAFGGWGLAVLLPIVALVQHMAIGGPDLAVTAVGSAGVIYLVDRHPLRASMLAYCGVGSILWLLMIPARVSPDVFMWFWWPYQLARLTAFGLFVKAAWKG